MGPVDDIPVHFQKGSESQRFVSQKVWGFSSIGVGIPEASSSQLLHVEGTFELQRFVVAQILSHFGTVTPHVATQDTRE